MKSGYIAAQNTHVTLGFFFGSQLAAWPAAGHRSPHTSHDGSDQFCFPVITTCASCFLDELLCAGFA
jgi:hypothetical protein